MENGRFVKICGIVKQLGFTAEQKAEFINIVNSIVPVDYEGKLKLLEKEVRKHELLEIADKLTKEELIKEIEKL